MEFFWGFGDFLGKCAVSGVDFSPFCKRLKMTAVVWIFRYAQNDKGFVILTYLVILSVAKYPQT